MISQGEIWWADLASPTGSGPGPGYRRPVVIVQGDPFNRSTLATVAVDRDLLTERVGKLSRAKLELVLTGIDVVLGR